MARHQDQVGEKMNQINLYEKEGEQLRATCVDQISISGFSRTVGEICLNFVFRSCLFRPQVTGVHGPLIPTMTRVGGPTTYART